MKPQLGAEHYKRDSCRLCDGHELELVVPIGKSPVGGAFVTESKLNTRQEPYPLDLYQCGGCGHVQLLDVVSPEVLFGDYSYFSGRTGLLNHFRDYSARVIEETSLKPGSLVVDVGSNDGGFLSFFKQRGMRVLGIDPAANVAAHANESGIETLPVMFDAQAAESIRSGYGMADIVSANNVYAHVDDMRGLTRDIKSIMKPGGKFYFEVSYLLDVVDKMLLGTIFHEHLSYHSVKPLDAFLRSEGLQLTNVRRVPIQGGSLICTAEHAQEGAPVPEVVESLIRLEEERGVYRGGFFDSLNSRIEGTKRDMGELVSRINSEGGSIAAFGAARGGILMTYLFDFGRHIKFIVDDDPHKQGLFSPGMHIPVLPSSELTKRMPDYTVVLAWVHSDAIVRANTEYLSKGGTFITFFPEVKLVVGEHPSQAARSGARGG